jgi:rifampicin phosphotransferase
MTRNHVGVDDARHPEPWDTLHSTSDSELNWTTSNVGEAVPGVPTPLTWSVWGPVCESALRGGAFSVGALKRSERQVPARLADRYVRIFYGRPALQADFLALVGDRMPGTTGQAVVRDLFGRVPEGMRFQPTRQRYPVVAARFPAAFLRSPGAVHRLSAETDSWWRSSLDNVRTADRSVAIGLLREGAERLDHAVCLQATVLLGVVTPLYTALGALVESTGVGDTAILSGTGGAEMEVVTDLWRASRGEIGLADVVRRHGFHGPGEGELSSAVWREDDSPLRALVAEYAKRGQDEDPRRLAAERRLDAEKMRAQLLDALPPARRPGARLLLRLAGSRILLRGVAKRSFLQSLDVIRAAARRTGELLVAEGRLDSADDVFFLTVDELDGDLPADSRDLVARRREKRATYARWTLPSDWRGMPTPILPTAAVDGQVRGIGVSPGVVEGRARVLLEPEFARVEPDEILVTPFTDPSWSSVMFISAALVVDIGGALSHAAVVARELGIPCVVNTRTGSKVLKTGDRLRVDGTAGTVEVLDAEDHGAEPNTSGATA